MVTVTPSPLAGMLLQSSSARSTDSSPSHSHSHSHSQMSRNSSRKSNNSVNCKLDGKLRGFDEIKNSYFFTTCIYLEFIYLLNFSIGFKASRTQILVLGSVDVEGSTERRRMLFIPAGGWTARRQIRV